MVVFASAFLLVGCKNDDTTVNNSIELPFKNVRDYGAKGDGITDDTSPLNSALSGGGDIYFPMGTYRVVSTLQVNKPSNLRGAGDGLSIIQMSATSATPTFLVRSSNTTISDLSVVGPSPSESTYIAGQSGILVGPKLGEQLCHNVRIRDCSVYNYGFQGIEFDSVATGYITDCNVYRIGYAAIACLSCLDVVVNGNVVESVKPGFQGNAYGIKFSHWTVQEPKSTRCVADGNIIQDIPVWEGLDTHDGTYITFSNNVVLNCKLGISAGPGNGATEPVHDIIISGNTIVAGDAAHQHNGIVVTGLLAAYAYNISVANNSVDGYGETGNDARGAIHADATGGVVVTGNSVTHSAEVGIVFWHHNTLFNCTGNLVDAVQSTTQAYGIRVRDRFNTGLIASNIANGLPICVNSDPSNSVTVTNNVASPCP